LARHLTNTVGPRLFGSPILTARNLLEKARVCTEITDIDKLRSYG
jgi:hypothetical protein